MRDSVGGVDLPDDLLCLKGGVLDFELLGHVSVILHVLPVVDVELDHLAVQLAQVQASFLVNPENSESYDQGEPVKVPVWSES